MGIFALYSTLRLLSFAQEIFPLLIFSTIKSSKFGMRQNVLYSQIDQLQPVSKSPIVLNPLHLLPKMILTYGKVLMLLFSESNLLDEKFSSNVLVVLVISVGSFLLKYLTVQIGVLKTTFLLLMSLFLDVCFAENT